MANTTISALPSATTPLSGTEVIPIVQSGVTKKVAASDIAVSGGVKSFQTSLSGLTPSTATAGVVTLAGTLGTASGGTGLTSFTANGVVYASSSSALTTGSALTFTGSLFSVIASTPAATPTWNSVDTAVFSQTSNSILQLHVGTSGGTLGFGFSSGTTRNAGLIGFDTGSPSFAFSLSGTEQMRLNSTGLGIGTSSPNASAILDAQSTTKGVRMPNMTTTQKNAISSPAAGLMVFDTTLAKLCVYSGSAWQTITSV
jgi:hypothetical protein